MTDEPSFLAAVRGRPDDRTARLVYADWLDERGDPRGELVRVEEEMRTLPAHADRYWGLKPRRNELRAGCTPEWLEVLGYGTVYRPTLADWPADWRGRWRVLREFIERWYRVPMPDVGGREVEVAEVERRLKRRLSPGVREWVAFCFDLRDGGPTAQVFREEFSPEAIAECDNAPAIVLHRSTEGDILVAVPTDQLTEPDSPVRLFCLMDDDDAFPGQPVGSITEYAFAFVRSHFRGQESDLRFTLPHDGDWIRQLEEHFLSQRRVGVIEVYEAENVVVTRGSWQPLTPDLPVLTVSACGPIADTNLARFLKSLTERATFIHDDR